AGWLITRTGKLFTRLWPNFTRFRRILNVFLVFFDFFFVPRSLDLFVLLDDAFFDFLLISEGLPLILSPFARAANATLAIPVKDKTITTLMNNITMSASWQAKLKKARIGTPGCPDLSPFLPRRSSQELVLTLFPRSSLPHGHSVPSDARIWPRNLRNTYH